MKKCTKCKKEKDLTEFGSDSSRADGKEYTCIECKRLRGKEYYDRKRRGVKRPQGFYGNRTRTKRLLLSDFSGRTGTEGCARCSYNKSPLALHLHHINPREGSNVSYRIEEAKKCIWLCANCHYEIHDALKSGFELSTYEAIKGYRE